MSVTPGPGIPVVAGGEFVKSTTDVDIWWVANGTSTKHHVDECTPCAGVDACSTFVTVPQAYINGLTTGPNFTCSLLPVGNARCACLLRHESSFACHSHLHPPFQLLRVRPGAQHGGILHAGGARGSRRLAARSRTRRDPHRRRGRGQHVRHVVARAPVRRQPRQLRRSARHLLLERRAGGVHANLYLPRLSLREERAASVPSGLPNLPLNWAVHANLSFDLNRPL